MTDNTEEWNHVGPPPGSMRANLAAKLGTMPGADHNGMTVHDRLSPEQIAALDEHRAASDAFLGRNQPQPEQPAPTGIAARDPRMVAAIEQHVADELAGQQGAYKTEAPTTPGARIRNETRRKFDAAADGGGNHIIKSY